MIRAFFWNRRWILWAYGVGLLVLLLTYAQVRLSVRFNIWYQGFYDLLQNIGKHSLADFNALLVQFLWIAMPYVVLATLTSYLSRLYAFQWREAITFSYLPRWSNVKQEIEGASQRIQEDAFRFARILESLGLQLANGIMTIIAFIPILWGLSKGIGIPWVGAVTGSLVWIALLTSVGGMGVSWIVGIRLTGLEYNNQKVEAAFRKELVYGEDDKEHFASMPKLTELFTGVRWNYRRLFINFAYYDIWQNVFNQGMVVVPYILAAPGLFSGALTLGIVFRIADAFGQVQNSFSILINNWVTVTEFRSIWNRLTEFEANLTGVSKS